MNGQTFAFQLFPCIEDAYMSSRSRCVVEKAKKTAKKSLIFKTEPYVKRNATSFKSSYVKSDIVYDQSNCKEENQSRKFSVKLLQIIESVCGDFSDALSTAR